MIGVLIACGVALGGSWLFWCASDENEGIATGLLVLSIAASAIAIAVTLLIS